MGEALLPSLFPCSPCLPQSTAAVGKHESRGTTGLGQLDRATIRTLHDIELYMRPISGPGRYPQPDIVGLIPHLPSHPGRASKTHQPATPLSTISNH